MARGGANEEDEGGDLGLVVLVALLHQNPRKASRCMAASEKATPKIGPRRKSSVSPYRCVFECACSTHFDANGTATGGALAAAFSGTCSFDANGTVVRGALAASLFGVSPV